MIIIHDVIVFENKNEKNKKQNSRNDDNDDDYNYGFQI